LLGKYVRADVATRHEFKVRKGPDGLHLFNRQSGINILLDSVIPPRSDWTNSPRQVSIALTNDCNLHCSHCYAPKHKSTLAKGKVKDWMLQLDELGTLGVGLGGGEPTLHPDFVELCKFGFEKTNLAISLTTHGHTLTDKLIDDLTDSVNFMRISMDGIYNTYEAIRKKPFRRLLEKLELLRSRIPFGINYVVNSQTIVDLNAAVNIADMYGAQEFLLLPEVSVGLGKQIDDVTLNTLKKWVAEYKGHLRLSISSDYKDVVGTVIGLEKELPWKSFIHIDATGTLKLSSFDKSGVQIGSQTIEQAYSKISRNLEVVIR
jgi:MoaA/NifB/PqqE/SkfB family radical SAM enzyme